MGSAFAGLTLGLSVLQLPAPTRAQSLVAGSWSGAVTDPYGHSKPVSYSVAGPPDSLSITLSQPVTQAANLRGTITWAKPAPKTGPNEDVVNIAPAPL